MKSKTNIQNGIGYVSESGGSSSPSPPRSPRRHSKFSHCRRRVRSKAHSQIPIKDTLVAGILFRRNLRYLLVLPLLYVSGLLMCVGPFSAFIGQPALPGSVYRSHEIFQKLWHEIESDNSSAIELSSVWKYKRKLREQKPCPNLTSVQHLSIERVPLGSTGYLIVEANGGLNQQRSAICNAVAVAGLLNAALVIPQFEFHSVWRDTSNFGDIYDEDHFIATLKGYVEVVKELPDVLMERYDYNVSNITNFRVQAWAPVSYYLGEVYSVLRKQGVIRLAPFANRLAMNVPPHIQFLRCLANYEALRFSPLISTLAKKLLNRMIEKSSKTGGKFVSVHLRFEEDMVAFSCCIYDGGRSEKHEMDLIREKGWRHKFKRKGRIISPGLNRVNGKCPLTPLEVGMMLRSMGFGNLTSIYLASGKIYQAERYLAPLLKMFPNLHTKESLATPDELAPLKEHFQNHIKLAKPSIKLMELGTSGDEVTRLMSKISLYAGCTVECSDMYSGYSSRLAALDYTLCLYSEVFVTTQGGNFPHFLMGQRRFLHDGHAKTIKPDKSKLVVLLEDLNISWKYFKDQMEAMLSESDRKGMVVPRVRKINRKTSVYTYPLPECRCLQQSHTTQVGHNLNIPGTLMRTKT